MPKPRTYLTALTLLTSAGLFSGEPQKPKDGKRKTPKATVEVIGIVEQTESIPGSGEVLDKQTLEKARVVTTEEALRRVPGLHLRDEEGFGLRPNIGIRGLNPTRSTKVLLLEDGIPLAYAPYGDNATYYHPPIERFERIEVLKGSGQILYGPQTIGGVVNYLTPPIPEAAMGEVALAGGNRGFRDLRATQGNSRDGSGYLAAFTHKEGGGARENTFSRLRDFNFKGQIAVGPDQTLVFKTSYYKEDSNITYSGLTESEYAQNPRFNPFKYDSMDAKRYGVSLAHRINLGENRSLTSTLYGSLFGRDWWRQSSNSAQRPDVETAGIQGRLRTYYVWGVEERFRGFHELLGAQSETEMGLRVHWETQDRRQLNGSTPQSRTGTIAEDNERKAQAAAAFLQNRVFLGKWTITPGVRFERVAYDRTNRLANGGAGIQGRTNLSQWIPGMGATYRPAEGVTLFAGIHRGFAPPRVEDIINNSTGGTVDLGAELSWNSEVGLRSKPRPGLEMEATLFSMDFENQIIPASLAGGVGATLTNGGRTLHQGAELTASVDSSGFQSSSHRLFLRTGITYLPTAKFQGRRLSAVDGTTPIEGNRLPYAPERTASLTLGYAFASILELRAEGAFVGEQFSDDRNVRVSTLPGGGFDNTGRSGLIPSYTVWNFAANVTLAGGKTQLFLTTKNLTDRLYLVDRSRGLLPGNPRKVILGLSHRF